MTDRVKRPIDLGKIFLYILKVVDVFLQFLLYKNTMNKMYLNMLIIYIHKTIIHYPKFWSWQD